MIKSKPKRLTTEATQELLNFYQETKGFLFPPNSILGQKKQNQHAHPGKESLEKNFCSFQLLHKESRKPIKRDHLKR
jgi:hypothetical protein